jgi:hypothetical protein
MTKPSKSKQKPEEPEQQPKSSQNVTSTRAKSKSHKKVTADKWNQ